MAENDIPRASIRKAVAEALRDQDVIDALGKAIAKALSRAEPLSSVYPEGLVVGGDSADPDK